MIAYSVPQHLERRTKLGPFTIPEWIRLCAAAALAVVVCRYAPWSFSIKGVATVVILAPQVCAAYLRDVYDLGMGHRLSGVTRRMVAPATYRPGPSKRLRGYCLVAGEKPEKRHRRGVRDGR